MSARVEIQEWMGKDMFLLGEFRPHWDKGYPSYHADRGALWFAHVSMLYGQARYTHVLPFVMEGAYYEPASNIRDGRANADIVENDAIVMGWHCDNSVKLGQTGPNADGWMIVWANSRPTQFRDIDGNEIQPLPYQVVAFRNGSWQHRTPPMTHEQALSRWFARMYVKPREPEPKRTVSFYRSMPVGILDDDYFMKMENRMKVAIDIERDDPFMRELIAAMSKPVRDPLYGDGLS